MPIKHYRSLVMTLSLLAGLTTPAHAIDCVTASTEREKTVCQSDILLAFDAVLNTAYRDAQKLSANPVEADPDRDLRREQLEWIAAADECSTQTACIRGLYARRYAALRSYSDMRFDGLEKMAGLPDVLELWVSADPPTNGIPAVMRSDSSNRYLMKVPVSAGKPFPFYEMYVLQQDKGPEKISFPDLDVSAGMASENNDSPAPVSAPALTIGTQFQRVQVNGRDLTSDTMTGGAGSEWVHRQWHVDLDRVGDVRPVLTEYEIENVRGDYSVKIVGK